MPFAVLLLALAAPPDPTAGSGALPAARRWPAVEAVARVTGGDAGGPVGTAVCVGVRDGHAFLLTADHVVPKGEGRAFEFYTRASYPAPARTLIGSDVLLRLPAADVALLRVPVGGPDPPPVLPLAGPGRRPKRFPAAAASVGCPTGSPPAFREEAVTGKKWVRRGALGTAFFWETAAASVGGMSGGPLLDTDGAVIGVCAATQDGRGYFAHRDEILAGLKDAGYDWLFAVPEAPGLKP